MTYEEWSSSNEFKKEEILAKLKGKSVDTIEKYFLFDNMVKVEPNFCGLYKDNKKCHEVEYLNCFNCACPYFKYTDDSKGLLTIDDMVVMSTCSINAKEGSYFISNNIAHQDCSNCTIPHSSKLTKTSIIARLY